MFYRKIEKTYNMFLKS